MVSFNHIKEKRKKCYALLITTIKRLHFVSFAKANFSKEKNPNFGFNIKKSYFFKIIILRIPNKRFLYYNFLNKPIMGSSFKTGLMAFAAILVTGIIILIFPISAVKSIISIVPDANVFFSNALFSLLPIYIILAIILAIPFFLIRNLTSSMKPKLSFILPIFYLIMSFIIYAMLYPLGGHMSFDMKSGTQSLDPLAAFLLAFVMVILGAIIEYIGPIFFIATNYILIYSSVLFILFILIYYFKDAKQKQISNGIIAGVILALSVLFIIIAAVSIDASNINLPTPERKITKLSNSEIEPIRSTERTVQVKRNFPCLISNGIIDTTIIFIFDSAKNDYELISPYPEYDNGLNDLMSEGYSVKRIDIADEQDYQLYFNCIADFNIKIPDLICSNNELAISETTNTLNYFAYGCMPWIGRLGYKPEYYD